MPPKRSREDDANETETFRRHKGVVNEAVAEFVCPITQSLPVDPVTAEDGKVYERSAIEEWLKEHQRSPSTNEAMGVKLLPALQVKNMIRTMVKSGALTGDKVDAWQARLAEEEEVEEWRREAAAGNGQAMAMLGYHYQFGKKGLVKNMGKAVEWYAKGEAAGHPVATFNLGICYVKGEGVPKCFHRGQIFMSAAAERGSTHSCYNLGLLHAEGWDGFPKDLMLARRFYSMVAGATKGPPLDDDQKERVAAFLRDHPA